MSEKLKWTIPGLELPFEERIHSKNNLAPVIHLLTRLILHVSVLITLYYSLEQNWYIWALFLTLLNGFLTSFLGWAGAGHEYFHSTAFKSGKFNSFLFRSFSCLSFNNWGWFEVSHLLHHKYTLHSKDPEGPPKKTLSFLNLFWLTTIDLPGFSRRIRLLFMNLFGLIPTQSDSVRAVLNSKPNLRKRIKVGAACVLSSQLFIFIVGCLFNPIFGLLLLFSPFTFTFTNKVMELNQHLGMKIHAYDYRDNSRTFRFNSFLEFLYSNMNFHAEHHMFPSVPYYQLPKLHRTLINQSEIQIPENGLWRAGKIAFHSNMSVGDSKDCLSCFQNCSKKSTLALD